MARREKGERHIGFQSWGTKKARPFSVSELRDVLAAVKSGAYGSIIRGKGFVATEHGMMAFSYAGGRYELTKTTVASGGVVCFIGEKPDRNKLERCFITEQLKFSK